MTEKQISTYIKEVIHPLLPNFKFRFGSLDLNQIGGQNEMCPGNAQLSNSPYYLELDKLEFAHFTSLSSAIEILRTGRIRLFDLAGLDDPLELSNSLSSMGLEDYQINEIKHKTFALSMTSGSKNDLENLINWRAYGEDGRGAALVLSFPKATQNDWLGYYLSSVRYDKSENEALNQLMNRHSAFESKHPLVDDLLQQVMVVLSAFHKKEIYQSENEYRLLWMIQHSYEENYKKWTFSNDGIKTFTELRLDNRKHMEEIEETAKKLDLYTVETMSRIFPDVRVAKVVLGYRHGLENVKSIQEVVKSYEYQYGYHIPIEQSSLSNFFKKK